MASLNKILLMGNMTRDPQLSYLPSQTPVVEFGLAISRKYKKQDGTQAEDVCFVDCQLFGKRAEVINKYFKKGEPIFVEGRLKFDSWTAQDGSYRPRWRWRRTGRRRPAGSAVLPGRAPGGCTLWSRRRCG
ncbi:MAG: single-stranded DNA-binding protein [Planctomycetota bacterium]